MKLFPKFQAIARCNPSKGNSMLLWADTWVDQSLQDKFPQLFSFARKPKCSVRFLLNQQLNRVFSPTLSAIAANQLIELQTLIEDRTWDENTNDTWSYSWGNSNFSSRKAYKALSPQEVASPLIKWLWNASNRGTHKFFFWLLIRDRLNIGNLLRRKTMQLPDYTCALCNAGVEEDYFHVFFHCNFSQQCWATIHIIWDFSLNPLNMIIKAKDDFNTPIFR